MVSDFKKDLDSVRWAMCWCLGAYVILHVFWLLCYLKWSLLWWAASEVRGYRVSPCLVCISTAIWWCPHLWPIGSLWFHSSYGLMVQGHSMCAYRSPVHYNCWVFSGEKFEMPPLIKSFHTSFHQLSPLLRLLYVIVRVCLCVFILALLHVDKCI